ncbi:hypothetical protein FAIPA1_400039 [Frankia sp. AiPs1]|uniref:DUF6314 family protein n=1 Tax=Frankia sp. AiPa1 TaxID=573492 RepID=UPI0027E54385|nr:DUF6314 family protein [Frankia sp. AiPa1]
MTQPSEQAPSDGYAAAAFVRLEGTWVLHRTISGIGTMEGEAVFGKLPSGVLRYREEGNLHLHSGYSGPAFREYYYLLEGNFIRVTFADVPPGERTFVNLRPERGDGDTFAAGGVHHCGPDVHSATYHFADESLAIMVEVRGPETNYTVHSVLTRRSNPADCLSSARHREMRGRAA